ncbi:copper amine oxidase N-terminal domain-containing protein [Paenibacillus aurantiacus]|uniref:Copper amine oxidase N-terminal domain-containing protein n=1 Tax=Paenibacillus aurantiacus TaxID=1936118 RepID=A0ABV5KNN8_9BACL
MNNKAMVLSAALLLGVMSAAQAAPVSAKGKQDRDRVQQEQSAGQTETKSAGDEADESKLTAEASAGTSGSAAVEDDDAEAKEVAAEAEDDDADAEDNEAKAKEDDNHGKKKGKGHDKEHGLQNAYKNTKDKPAGERIAQLLKEKYGIDVTAETKEQIEAIVTDLEAKGDTDAAEDTQAELVAGDPTNVELYVKLGKIKEKNGKKGVKAYVNGSEPKFDVAPVKKDGRVLVPFRAIAEALEADVKWDAASKTITVTRDGVEVKLTLGSKVAYVNGTEIKLDVPGQSVNNRVLVPLRFLSEALKSNVVWEPETSSVIVNDAATEDGAAATEGTDANSATADTTTTEASTTDTTTTGTTESSATTEPAASTDAAATNAATEASTTTESQTTTP